MPGAVAGVHATPAKYSPHRRHQRENGVLNRDWRPRQSRLGVSEITVRHGDLRKTRDPLLIGLAITGEPEQGLEKGLRVQRRTEPDADQSLSQRDVPPAMGHPSRDGELIANLEIALATPTVTLSEPVNTLNSST